MSNANGLCASPLLIPYLKIYNKISKTKLNRARMAVSICDAQSVLSASQQMCLFISPGGEELLPGLNCLPEIIRINNRNKKS